MESKFDALLEDVRPGWRELLNVLHGAVAMQITHFGRMAPGLHWPGRWWQGWCRGKCPIDISPSRSYFGRAEAAKLIPALVVKSLNRSSLMAIIEKHNLYGSQRTQKPLEDLIERMRLKHSHPSSGRHCI